MKDKEKKLQNEIEEATLASKETEQKEKRQSNKRPKTAPKRSEQEREEQKIDERTLSSSVEKTKKQKNKHKKNVPLEENLNEVVQAEIKENTNQIEEPNLKKEAKSRRERKRNRVIPKEELEKKKLTIPFIGSTSQKEGKNKKQEIERFTPNKKIGLTKEEVSLRIEQGLVNHVDKKNSKTYTRIFLTNIFTFFNLLCFGVCGALIAVNAWSNLI